MSKVFITMTLKNCTYRKFWSSHTPTVFWAQGVQIYTVHLVKPVYHYRIFKISFILQAMERMSIHDEHTTAALKFTLDLFFSSFLLCSSYTKKFLFSFFSWHTSSVFRFSLLWQNVRKMKMISCFEGLGVIPSGLYFAVTYFCKLVQPNQMQQGADNRDRILFCV